MNNLLESLLDDKQIDQQELIDKLMTEVSTCAYAHTVRVLVRLAFASALAIHLGSIVFNGPRYT